MEYVVKYAGSAAALFGSVGVGYEDLGAGYALIEAGREAIETLVADPRTVDVEPSRRAFVESGEALRLSCIPEGRGSSRPPLSGAGVLCGIIDTGIDFTHPDFIDAEGGTRIAALWDMPRGAVYDAVDIDAALAAPDPFAVIARPWSSGHGTAVAGIAAGNAYGAAPGARIIAVRAGGESALTADLMRAAAFTVARAAELGAPLCCNLSYGLGDGPRGATLFEGYLDALAQSARCSFFAPTGNEGSSGRHASAELAAGGEAGLEFFTGNALTSVRLLAVSDFADDISCGVTFPDGYFTGSVPPWRRLFTARRGGATLVCATGQPDRYTAQRAVRIEITAEGGLPPGAWSFELFAGEVASGRVECWLSSSEGPAPAYYFARPDPYLTMTVPSTAGRVCAVAGYDGRTRQVAGFSGAGAREGAPYPDLAAPAVGVMSARAGGGYDAFTGTSFASPQVCGAAACAMERGIVRGVDPFLYGERMRAFLRAGARRNGGVCPDPRYGYGALCLDRTLALIAEYEGEV